MSHPERHFDWQRLIRPSASPPVVADSARRTVALLGIFVVLIGVVLARCVWLEVSDGPGFRTLAQRPRTVRQRIAATRGAILARDGTVLARDREMHGLAIHYRHLERPLDAAWLRDLARDGLPDSQRKDETSVAEAAASLEQEIQDAHQRLAAQCGFSEQQWQARCRQVQQRVERMAASVNRRRQAHVVQRGNARRDAAASSDSWSGVLADALAALFAPPADLPPPRIHIREENDYHLIVADLPKALAEQLKRDAEQYPGVRVQQHEQRGYPYGSLAAHVVGHVQVDDQRGVSGRAGAERSCEDHLAGNDGGVVHAVDRSGQRIAEIEHIEAAAGDDVVLTLEVALQRTAEQLLDDACRRRRQRDRRQVALSQETLSTGGAIVVMDSHSGQVLCAATSPRFDPNDFARRDSDGINLSLSDADHAMFDRCIQMAIPPGSVFKALTAINLLESGTMDADAPLHCRGYLQTPDRMRCQLYRRYGVGHGPVNMSDALAQSCNVYFFHHAATAGPAPLVSWAARFGFGQPTGIELPEEAAGYLPSPRRHQEEFELAWQEADTQALAIGQGMLTATPLQVVRMMATISNGGFLVTPRIRLASVAGRYRPGSVTTDRNARVPVPGLHEDTLQAVQHGLRRAVSDPAGTAHRTVFSEDLAVAGKTGTAQNGTAADHAWLAGYVPAARPQVAFVVVLQHAGSGGAEAGPLAAQLVRRMRQLGYF